MARSKKQKVAGRAYKLVMVEWQDIWSGGTWRGEAELAEMQAKKMQLVTVGFLVSEDDDAIVLACTKGLTSNQDFADVNGVWRIPKGVISKLNTVAKVVL